MSGHQIIVATGHLGDLPRSQATRGGTLIVTFSIAVTDKWKDRDNQLVEHTEWLRIKCFGQNAEYADHYLRKGSLVTVTGKIRTEKWQAQDGSDRYSQWIYADEVRGYGSRDHETTRTPHQGRARNTEQQETTPGNGVAPDDLADDIPF